MTNQVTSRLRTVPPVFLCPAVRQELLHGAAAQNSVWLASLSCYSKCKSSQCLVSHGSWLSQGSLSQGPESPSENLDWGWEWRVAHRLQVRLPPQKKKKMVDNRKWKQISGNLTGWCEQKPLRQLSYCPLFYVLSPVFAGLEASTLCTSTYFAHLLNTASFWPFQMVKAIERVKFPKSIVRKENRILPFCHLLIKRETPPD